MTQLVLPTIGWRPFVFSIRPRFLAMFRLGVKLYEFRRRRPKVNAGEEHLIYETAPTSAVVASARIGKVIDGDLDEVWARAGSQGGITRREFDEYFSDLGELRSRAVAIEMDMTWMETKLELPQAPPQAWAVWKGPWPLAA